MDCFLHDQTKVFALDLFFFLTHALASLKERVEQNKVGFPLMALLGQVFIFCVWFYSILNSDNKVAFPL